MIIRQGDEGDYFYVIVDGPLRGHPRDAAQPGRHQARRARHGRHLRRGGADLRGATRNATVTMLTDGVLMRLGKDDFNTLLNEPMLHWVDHDQAKRDRRQGRRLARRAPAERVRALAPRAVAQRAAVLHPPEAQDARPGRALRRHLRQRAPQLGGRLHPERTRLRRLRAEGRRRRHRPGRYADPQIPPADAGSAVTSCGWACRRPGRRPGKSRSCAGSGRGPAR